MNKTIKCVVWDLDNTLWRGVISENDKPELDKKMIEVIKYLDQRGVLNSIASRNDKDLAVKYLKGFGIDHYFVSPCVSWGDKSKAIETIANNLNIAVDSFCFVDDQEFEREEVKFNCPEVVCFSPEKMFENYSSSLFPSIVSQDSKLRRSLYQTEFRRKKAESEFSGDNHTFLSELKLEMRVEHLVEKGLIRAEELTLRTHQLNTTGYTYNQDELIGLSKSPKHLVLTVSLKDKFGDYGTVGLCVIDKSHQSYLIKLFLLSCRVMSRGISGAFLQYILDLAVDEKLPLRAEYIANGRNKQMLMTYKFSGFNVISKHEDKALLEHKGNEITLVKSHVAVTLGPESLRAGVTQAKKKYLSDVKISE